jgi:hypothetical protein
MNHMGLKIKESNHKGVFTNPKRKKKKEKKEKEKHICSYHHGSCVSRVVVSFPWS